MKIKSILNNGLMRLMIPLILATSANAAGFIKIGGGKQYFINQEITEDFGPGVGFFGRAGFVSNCGGIEFSYGKSNHNGKYDYNEWDNGIFTRAESYLNDELNTEFIGLSTFLGNPINDAGILIGGGFHNLNLEEVTKIRDEERGWCSEEGYEEIRRSRKNIPGIHGFLELFKQPVYIRGTYLKGNHEDGDGYFADVGLFFRF